MTIDEMRQIDAIKTYKELEETKKTNAELVQRMKEDGEYILTLSERCLQYHEAVLKYKEEIKRLTDKIEQLHAGSEEQRQRITRLENVGDEMARWLSSPRNIGGDRLMAEEWDKAKEDKP